MTIERTLAILKPDATSPTMLTNDILNMIRHNGFKIIAKHELTPSDELIKKHYPHLINKEFFPNLLEYMTSGQNIALVLEKENAIEDFRTLVGATHPKNATPNTIRGKYGDRNQDRATLKNLIHASDSKENAQKEIALWFDHVLLSQNVQTSSCKIS